MPAQTIQCLTATQAAHAENARQTPIAQETTQALCVTQAVALAAPRARSTPTARAPSGATTQAQPQAQGCVALRLPTRTLFLQACLSQASARKVVEVAARVPAKPQPAIPVITSAALQTAMLAIPRSLFNAAQECASPIAFAGFLTDRLAHPLSFAARANASLACAALAT